MALTLSTFQTRVTSAIRDSSNNIVTTTDLTAYGNEAKSDLAHRLGVLSKTLTGTTSGNTIALPADTVRPLSLRLSDEDDVDLSLDDESFFNAYDAGSTLQSTIGRIHAGSIELYPTPTTGTAYSLRYVYEPTDMSASGDVSGLPAELDNKILNYMKAQASYKLGDATMGDRYMAMYEDGLPAHPLGRTKTKPSLTIRVDASPFEQSSYTSYG